MTIPPMIPTADLDDPALSHLSDFADIIRIMISRWEAVRELPDAVRAGYLDMRALPVVEQIAANAERDMIAFVGLLAGDCQGVPEGPHALHLDGKRYVVRPGPDGSPEMATVVLCNCRRPA